ncbi:MAG: penicillin-binding protein 2 [Acidobacteria bacterium]|nr:MAG: penicillin-binding protein 2 [Acidobacteriota bacterium]
MPASAREDRRPVLFRIEALGAGAWAVFIGLLVVYWVHQVLRGDEYARQAENNRLRSVPIVAPRGFILDRNGTPLAENEPSFSLLLYRRETKDLDASLRFAAGLLGREADELRRRVERDRAAYDFVPIVLEDNLTLAEVGAVEARALEHPEFVVQTSERRVYKEGAVAAHLLGHLGEASTEQLLGRAGRVRPGDRVGQKGVEAVYQDLLSGTSGARTFVIDSFGREVTELARAEPRAGNTLVLTVDLPLQRLAEELFGDQVGAAVVLDPRTGEILAMVSSPAYDPNVFTRRMSQQEWDEILRHEGKPLNNRVLQNVYSPGSVFKAIVAWAALVHGTNPAERVVCTGGASFYGRTFRCHGVHGSVDLPTALQVSCDVYFYTMGKRLGVDAIAEASGLFGLGRPTGIDLAHEKTGVVPSTSWSLSARKHPWYPGETISVAIGQGPLLTSTLQVARAFAAIANPDGALPTPHLFHIGEHVATRERFAYRPPSRESVPFPPGVREPIVEGLWRVVNAPGGTAYSSRVPGAEICGKTGSVQVVAQKDTKKAHLLPGHLKDHGWFAGFAPRNDPRVVAVVFAEHGEHGATAAAPIATKLMAAWLSRTAGAAAPGPLAAAAPEPPLPRGGG